jgi:hypothetical protein
MKRRKKLKRKKKEKKSREKYNTNEKIAYIYDDRGREINEVTNKGKKKRKNMKYSKQKGKKIRNNKAKQITIFNSCNIELTVRA